MRIAVLCEFSGHVRNAFINAGHDAISCDLLPSESSGPHIQADCRFIDWSSYDCVIAHPPCTYLAVSGAKWWNQHRQDQIEALGFFRHLALLPVKHIAIENPIGYVSTIRKPDQIIQPWMFGHEETKATCLWLKNLPCLIPTDIRTLHRPRVHFEPPSKDRWKNRSRTLPGIAHAMATQWCL